MSIKFLTRTLFAGLAVLALGCQKSTTQEDVADAKEKVASEQQDLAEAEAEGRENVAEEQQDLYEARKPVLDEDANENIAEERQDVAEAETDAAAAIREEEADIEDAQRDLQQTQKEFNATQARDDFALDVERKLSEADQKIATLEQRADAADGAEKQALQTQIDQLKEQRERVKDALDELKTAELTAWKDHQTTVDAALRELETMHKDI